MLGAARQQDRVEFAPQIFHRDIAAHVRVGLELHAFTAHLLQTAVDQVLLHLEIRDAVTQQTADAVVLFEDRDPVPRARQLLRGRQPRGTGPDHRHALARARFGGLRVNKSLFECAVDDGLFDLLDGHRRLIDTQHARGFARRGADAAGEFREVIGGVQHAHRVLPTAAIHQVVPIGNDVSERAAGMAEWHAAIHAARALRLHALFGERIINLEPILDTQRRVATRRQFARVLHEPGNFTHESPPRRSPRRSPCRFPCRPPCR